MTALRVRVRHWLAEYCPAALDDGLVVIAVSGGPDSLALLHLLHLLHVRLHIVHLDHQLRPESAAEARVVADIAAAWHVPATITPVDIQALAGSQNIYQVGRQARYRLLADVAQAEQAVAVAVAHTADDQAETVLINLLRGAGPAGLRGMRAVVPWTDWQRYGSPDGVLHAPLNSADDAPAASTDGAPSSTAAQASLASADVALAGTAGHASVDDVAHTPSTSAVHAPLTGAASASTAAHAPLLIRPLIHARRSEILAYCATHGLAPIEDPSNADTRHTRSWVRHHVIPLLTERNPDVIATLNRTAQVLADAHDFVEHALDVCWDAVCCPTDAGFAIDRVRWRVLHPALQGAALRRAHSMLAPREPLQLERVEAARAILQGRTPGMIELPGGVRVLALPGGAATIVKA